MSCSTSDQTVKRDNMVYVQAKPVDILVAVVVIGIVFLFTIGVYCKKCRDDQKET